MDQQLKDNLIETIVESYNLKNKSNPNTTSDDSDNYKQTLIQHWNTNLNQFLQTYHEYLNISQLYLLFQQPLEISSLRLIQHLITKTNAQDRTISNRRLTYLNKVLVNEQYFSLDSIKEREPALYTTMFEHTHQGSEREASELKVFPESMNLVDRIYFNIDMDRKRKLNQKVKQELEDGYQEFDEDSDDEQQEKEEEGGNGSGVEVEDDEQLELELVRLCKELFLAGKDTQFDYSTVDNNSEYDDRELVETQLLDTYFDEETDAYINSQPTEYTGIQDY